MIITMDYEKKYKDALERARNIRFGDPNSATANVVCEEIFPELKESEDEKIRKNIKIALMSMEDNLSVFYSTHHTSQKELLAWLEKQGEQNKQKEINLVEILKHYPIETELYSPLYGKLWLAKVDEEHEIITCYRYPLEEDCTRAVIEQEDTVSFYSNGTTGLPDFSISKDCMLFLYNNEKQSEQKHKIQPKFNKGDIIIHKELGGDYIHNSHKIIQVDILDKEYRLEGGLVAHFSEEDDYELVEQNPAWSEEDEHRIKDTIYFLDTAKKHYADTSEIEKAIDWLKSIKPQSHWKPTEEQLDFLINLSYNSDLYLEERKFLEDLYVNLKKL